MGMERHLPPPYLAGLGCRGRSARPSWTSSPRPGPGSTPSPPGPGFRSRAWQPPPWGPRQGRGWTVMCWRACRNLRRPRCGPTGPLQPRGCASPPLVPPGSRTGTCQLDTLLNAFKPSKCACVRGPPLKCTTGHPSPRAHRLITHGTDARATAQPPPRGSQGSGVGATSSPHLAARCRRMPEVQANKRTEKVPLSPHGVGLCLV